MENLEKTLKEVLSCDHGKISNFNKDLGVVRIAHSYCDNGRLYGWSEFVTF